MCSRAKNVLPRRNIAALGPTYWEPTIYGAQVVRCVPPVLPIVNISAVAARWYRFSWAWRIPLRLARFRGAARNLISPRSTQRMRRSCRDQNKQAQGLPLQATNAAWRKSVGGRPPCPSAARTSRARGEGGALTTPKGWTGTPRRQGGSGPVRTRLHALRWPLRLHGGKSVPMRPWRSQQSGRQVRFTASVLPRQRKDD